MTMYKADTYKVYLDISNNRINVGKLKDDNSVDADDDGGIVNASFFDLSSPFATKVTIVDRYSLFSDLSGCYLKIHSGVLGKGLMKPYINIYGSDDKLWNCLYIKDKKELAYTDLTPTVTLGDASRFKIFTVQIKDGCFPKNAMVQTPDGEKQCGKLKINDMVLVGDNKYEKIVLFSHFDKHTVSNFTQLTLSNGKSVSATGSHLITVFNGNQETLKSFDTIAVGDKVQYNNKLRSVESKAEVVGKGLVCPVTANGNIVVDNVLCTCHASKSSMKVLTPIVHALAAADINVPNKHVKRYNAIR